MFTDKPVNADTRGQTNAGSITQWISEIDKFWMFGPQSLCLLGGSRNPYFHIAFQSDAVSVNTSQGNPTNFSEIELKGDLSPLI